MSNIELPTTYIGNDEWIVLGKLGKKFIFRALSIKKANKRVPEPSGHHYDQAVAEGSVKFRPKVWDISMLKS